MDYDEAVAFPRLKPDIDVFRPPFRSRKQRGWYQISKKASRPLLEPSPHRDRTRLPMCDDLPGELVASIILDHSFDHAYPSDWANQTGIKHHLGTRSLVCRHWEGLCRSELLTKLDISSHHDYRELERFVLYPVTLDVCSFC